MAGSLSLKFYIFIFFFFFFFFAVRWDCELQVMSNNVYTFTMVEDQVNSMQRRCMEITWIDPADKNFLLVRFSQTATGKYIQLPQRKRVTLWRACWSSDIIRKTYGHR